MNVVTANSSAAPRVMISLARPNDAAAIARFKRRLSNGHAGPRQRDDARIETGRDHAPGSAAIAVIARDRDSGIVVGHAVVVPASDGAAKLALTVADAYHHHQIGTRLLEGVLQEARQRGVRSFRADGFVADRRVLDIFASKGCALVADSAAGRLISANARRD